VTRVRRQFDKSTAGKAQLVWLRRLPRKALRLLSLSLAVALLGAGLSACGGCGGAKSATDSIVARIGSKTITTETLDHWTATFVRGDFYATTRKKAPPGLATNPPDYSACVAAAKEIRSPQATEPRLTDEQLRQKCRELYESVKREALSYLISVIWSEGQAAEQGFGVTDAAIAARIRQTQREDYGSSAAFADYLVNKGWTRADLNFIVRRNLLVGKVLKALEEKAGKGVAGVQALAKSMAANARRWTLRTRCARTLVVEQCNDYTGATTKGVSAAVIFERMRGLSL
jgi:hypothetical protein